MSRLDVQFLDQGFHRVLFNAMPMPVFVVDQDVCILDYNHAAAQLIEKGKKLPKEIRGGDVLGCVNAAEHADGCGRGAACGDCVIRKSVRAAFGGKHITRAPARMQLRSRGKATRVDLRVTCEPFTYQKRSYALLILEGLND
jgi:hypothetical protein